ncbi:energy-coupling factor transporter transmembrane protein EcfT [Candidatus Solincola tengchongensis]|uniref:energy-coupling factor transporter transmembrane component T family protein n=1 Tax=Candidatus Solincola tengchongensis TaxID=2900693 RepID=UPI002580FEFD|nr:energy-coupling factor transporter transmembrane protein EcfT [Candidatus Solincola tengchongensis]
MKGLRRIRIGQYYPLPSPVHRLDPRTKLACTLALLVGAFLVRRPGGVVLLLVFSLTAIYLAKLPPGQTLSSLRSVALLLLITGLAQLLFSPGREIWRWGPLVITNTGLENGALYSLRLALAVLLLSILTMTTGPVEMLSGLESLAAPLRVLGLPVRDMAMILTAAFRFLPLLLGRAGDIALAQEARGADFSSRNPVRRMLNLVPLLVPLFSACFRDAEELGAALAARGYRGEADRTRYRAMRFRRSDLLALSAVAAVVALSLWLPA